MGRSDVVDAVGTARTEGSISRFSDVQFQATNMEPVVVRALAVRNELGPRIANDLVEDALVQLRDALAQLDHAYDEENAWHQPCAGVAVGDRGAEDREGQDDASPEDVVPHRTAKFVALVRGA